MLATPAYIDSPDQILLSVRKITLYVERLVDEGMITAEEAKNHKMSNVLVNVLGSKNAIPYVSFGEKDNLVAGDSFFCVLMVFGIIFRTQNSQ